MRFNYNKLRGKIRETFKTQYEFAEAMGMSKSSISVKLNNKVEFTQTEIENSVDILKIKKEEIPAYFFKLKA